MNVKTLSIIFNTFLFTLPEAYPTLRTLCLAGPNMLSGLLTVSMPCLEELVIQYSKYTVLEQVANLRDIGRIHTIRVTAVPKARLAHKRRNESRELGALLAVCKSLQTLKADEYVLSLLLEDWKHYLQPTSPLRVFFINTSGQDREIDLNDVNSTPGWNKVVELADESEAGS
ncbi:hypothetical protein FRC19_006501 [Serendipita sp. 401]|nr:hypothetical protein FRC19_006501 [Serendipita sp. 401]KAG9058489.1 hypothetical protein FS842_008786 [Serendipita sp. 407]